MLWIIAWMARPSQVGDGKLTMQSPLIQASNAIEYFSTGFIEFQLVHGPIVRVQSLRAELTYWGWLEGLPQARFNSQMIADVAASARKSYGESVPIYVCDVPRHTLKGHFSSAGDGQKFVLNSSEIFSAEFLPRLRVFAYCKAISDVPEPDTFTQLVIAWYQDELEPMPAPKVRYEIERMDWYRYAQPFNPG